MASFAFADHKQFGQLSSNSIEYLSHVCDLQRSGCTYETIFTQVMLRGYEHHVQHLLDLFLQ